MAEALAQAGQHDQAEQTARSITDPYEQAPALAAVAEALAQAGQHDQAATVATAAEQTARSLTDPYEQAPALTAVAEALAQAGQHRPARRVSAAACAVGRWTVALKPVLQLDPGASGLLWDLVEDQVSVTKVHETPGAIRHPRRWNM